MQIEDTDGCQAGQTEEHFITEMGKHRKKDFEEGIKEINLTDFLSE